MHVSINRNRLTNLLGALAVASTDLLTEAVERSVGQAASAPACLLTIVTTPGISVDSLRRILGISQPATVRLVDRLVAAGLVERTPGPDHRTLALMPTEEGRRRAQTALTQRHEALGSLLSSFDDGELSHLCDLLERMLAELPRSREHARHLCRLCDHDACERLFCPVDRATPCTPS